MDPQLRAYIDNQIRLHIHDGNLAQRVNFSNLFGITPTVTATPTGTPTTVSGQYQIYNGQLYFYDTVNAMWRSSGGVLFDHYVDAGNVTTGETDLYSDTIAAKTLSNNGDKLLAEYDGVFVSSGTATREIKLYFGGTMIFDTGALTLSLSAAWAIYLSIIRVSASVVRTAVSMTTEGAALAAYTSYAEVTGLTLSNTNVLKITGQAAGVGAATNDIVAKMGYVERKSAA